MAMLTDEITPSGERRIYFTQIASVVAYFTEDESGDGVVAHAVPGEFACPWSTTPAKVEAVRLAMIEETARRLNCPVDQVKAKTINDISRVSDPLLSARPTWASKARKRVPGCGARASYR